jgi:hypothetical protein
VGIEVDDPDDQEILTLVEQTRNNADEIFGEGCSKEYVSKLLQNIVKESSSPNTITEMTAFATNYLNTGRST